MCQIIGIRVPASWQWWIRRSQVHCVSTADDTCVIEDDVTRIHDGTNFTMKIIDAQRLVVSGGWTCLRESRSFRLVGQRQLGLLRRHTGRSTEFSWSFEIFLTVGQTEFDLHAETAHLFLMSYVYLYVWSAALMIVKVNCRTLSKKKEKKRNECSLFHISVPCDQSWRPVSERRCLTRLETSHPDLVLILNDEGSISTSIEQVWVSRIDGLVLTHLVDMIVSHCFSGTFRRFDCSYHSSSFVIAKMKRKWCTLLIAWYDDVLKMTWRRIGLKRTILAVIYLMSIRTRESIECRISQLVSHPFFREGTHVVHNSSAVVSTCSVITIRCTFISCVAILKREQKHCESLKRFDNGLHCT